MDNQTYTLKENPTPLSSVIRDHNLLQVETNSKTRRPGRTSRPNLRRKRHRSSPSQCAGPSNDRSNNHQQCLDKRARLVTCSPRDQLQMVQDNPFYIGMCSNPTREAQLEAVKRAAEVILLLTDPCAEAMRIAISNDPTLFESMRKRFRNIPPDVVDLTEQP